jgi:hypothetical protein
MGLVDAAEFELVEAEDDRQENGDDADREHGLGPLFRLKVLGL